MPDLHFSDELLDQYALGTMAGEQLAGVEEHLLICPHCQSRLEAADEFAMLFRAAAVQPDARPGRGWSRFWNPRSRVAGWAAAAAAAAAILLILAGPLRKAPIAPATVFMQALRGPDAPDQILAGKPATLVFEIVPAAGVEYEVHVVNPVGSEVVTAKAVVKDGRVSVLVNKLPPGSYWVRLYRTDTREEIAEYVLRAR